MLRREFPFFESGKLIRAMKMAPKPVQYKCARALLLMNEKRLPGKLWKGVPVPSDLGINYKIPHQFQGFMVKKGTPKAKIYSKLIENGKTKAAAPAGRRARPVRCVARVRAERAAAVG